MCSWKVSITGTVPQAYYDFVMNYAPYFYVIPTSLAQDASSGQKNVTISDGSMFQSGYPVQIKDNSNSEWNTVASVNGNVLTMQNNLAYTYFVAKSGVVEGPDPAFGKGAFPAAFAIDFLYQAYSSTQFQSNKTDILNKIIALADFILTQQCTNQAKKAYGDYAGPVPFYQSSAQRGNGDGSGLTAITRVTDWKFNIENNLKEVPVIGSTAYLLKYLQARQRVLSGEVTFEFESKGEFDDAVNDAEFSLSFGLGSNSALFKYCKWNKVTVPTKIEDLVSLKASFVARDVVMS